MSQGTPGQIVDALRQVVDACGLSLDAAQDLDVRTVPVNDTWITLPAHCLRPAVLVLIEQFGVRHLSTITAQDMADESMPGGGHIQVLYHFWRGQGWTLCVHLPLQDPRLPTLTDLIPGAAFYEREAAEMLGITFTESPDSSPLILPDDWEGGAPLRRAYTPGSRE